MIEFNKAPVETRKHDYNTELLRILCQIACFVHEDNDCI